MYFGQVQFCCFCFLFCVSLYEVCMESLLLTGVGHRKHMDLLYVLQFRYKHMVHAPPPNYYMLIFSYNGALCCTGGLGRCGEYRCRCFLLFC
ncbi:hypothetical protein V8C35DRAFT_287498 [Trichoderma chlorosporum]